MWVTSRFGVSSLDLFSETLPQGHTCQSQGQPRLNTWKAPFFVSHLSPHLVWKVMLLGVATSLNDIPVPPAVKPETELFPPQSLMDFFKLYFLINFSWSRVALQCCVSFCLTAKGTSPLCFGFPSHLGHRRALSRVPLLPSGLSSVINCIHSSVYVSIPASQFIPPPLFPPGVHSLFFSSVSLSVL